MYIIFFRCYSATENVTSPFFPMNSHIFMSNLYFLIACVFLLLYLWLLGCQPFILDKFFIFILMRTGLIIVVLENFTAPVHSTNSVYFFTRGTLLRRTVQSLIFCKTISIIHYAQKTRNTIWLLEYKNMKYRYRLKRNVNTDQSTSS